MGGSRAQRVASEAWLGVGVANSTRPASGSRGGRRAGRGTSGGATRAVEVWPEGGWFTTAPRSGLMAELALSGDDHRNAALVRGLDHLAIAHRAAGLDDRTNACIGRLVDAVAEREERIGSEHGALGRVA